MLAIDNRILRGPARRLWILAICLAAIRPGLGAVGPIRTYTEQDGLPDSRVVDAAQAGDGRIWFVTESEAVAYDGTDWSAIEDESGRALQDGFGVDLAGDGTGWLVTTSGELARVDGDRFRRVAPPRIDPGTDRVTAFAVLRAGGRETPAIGTSRSGVMLLQEDEWIDLRGRGLPERVNTLLSLDGELWIGTSEGLWSWRDQELTRVSVPKAGPSSAILGLAADDRSPGTAGRRIWIAGRGWIGSFDDEGFHTLTRRTDHPGLAPHARLELVPDGRGGVYYGNPGALFHFDARTGRVLPLDQSAGLVGGGVNDFLRDREGNLWIATAVGVSKIANTPFENLTRDNGLLEDAVNAVAELPGGEIVLGHAAGVTFYRDGESWTVNLAPSSRAPGQIARVSDMETDDQGRLWLAMAGWGLARISPGGEVDWIYRSRDTQDWIYSVRADRSGRLWVCGSEGVFVVRGDRLEPVVVPGLGSSVPRRIFRGTDGMYFATDRGGLFHRDDAGGWRAIASQRNLEANNVFAMLEDRAGRLLVGTRHGLMIATGDSLRRPDDPGLPWIDRPVYFLVEDPSDRLWIGTNYGVYRWQPDEGLRHFAVRQGLAGLETNRAAGFVDSRGALWIGTDRGVSRFDESSAQPHPPPPRVELLARAARERSLAPAQRPELSHDPNDLRFDLRAVSFVDESHLVFRVRLLGLDPEWVVHESTTRLTLRYPRLPPGTYRLVAQARHDLGSWGPEIRSAEIRVTPVFWKRGWFFIVGVSTLLAAVYALHSILVQRRYAGRLKQEVELRTRDLERSQQAARSERDRLTALLCSIDDGVIAVDSNDDLVLVNPAARRMLDLPEESSRRNRLDAALGGTNNAVHSEVRRLVALARAATAEVERTLLTLPVDGEPRDLEIAAAPYAQSDGARPGVVLVFHDITERMRAESVRARARRIEALGVLAAGIAHDFNNIMTAILGNVSLVRGHAALPVEAQRRLDSAGKALERASRLSRQLVTFAKGGAPVTESASIADVLRESSDFVLSGSAIGCRIQLAEDLWDVQIDASQIHQVFENLLLNARQALDGRGRIEIRASNQLVERQSSTELTPGRYVRVDVSDDAGGISAADCDRIFEPYFTTKPEGTGLGLATSYSIVKRHRGQLAVRSEPGSGSTFSVLLPASPEPRAAGRPTNARVAKSGYRVLVLEDEAPVAHVLRDMLRHLGNDVTIARSGDEAVAVCEEQRSRGRSFDLAILDLTVPGGPGGAEILPRLLSLDPALRAIASSGYSEGNVMNRYAEFGFSAVLPKPYTLVALATVIRKVLENSTDPGRIQSPTPSAR